MYNMNDQDGISIASEGKAESDSSSVVADNNNIETPKQQGESLILSPVSASVFNDERASFNGQQEDNDSSFPVPVGDITCWKHTTGIGSFFSLSWGWVKLNKAQILSGVDPIVGLQSAWIMGIITSLFGGRPGMVAGSTGAIAVVLPSLVENHGIGYMFYAIMLAGILQIVFGLFRLGVLVRMIPHPVMVGFCNGLGIVIGVAQFNIFKIRPDDEVVEEGERKLLEIGGAFAPFTNGWEWVDATMVGWMVFHIIIALLTYAFFPKIPVVGKMIPASLAAIIITTILEWALVRPIGYETNTVKDLQDVRGDFPIPVWTDSRYTDLMPPLNGETFGIIFPVAITAGAIGLLESLLTLEIIDEMTNTKGNGNREAFGQGLGNLLSGMFGGMGGCTTIGQSMMNLHSGGYTRLSSTVAACFMLLIILVAYPLINLIPVAGLAGVMFVVTYFTIEWESAAVVFGSMLPQKYREKYGMKTKVKRTDVLVMLVVVAVTLVLDLAIAVAFQKLNVASRRLMHKSKDLWEGINVFEEENVVVEDDPLMRQDHYAGNTHL
eukprot:scaffold854_cov247-Chaetoceros_neogracile.AAC.3